MCRRSAEPLYRRRATPRISKERAFATSPQTPLGTPVQLDKLRLAGSVGSRPAPVTPVAYRHAIRQAVLPQLFLPGRAPTKASSLRLSSPATFSPDMSQRRGRGCPRRVPSEHPSARTPDGTGRFPAWHAGCESYGTNGRTPLSAQPGAAPAGGGNCSAYQAVPCGARYCPRRGGARACGRAAGGCKSGSRWGKRRGAERFGRELRGQVAQRAGPRWPADAKRQDRPRGRVRSPLSSLRPRGGAAPAAAATARPLPSRASRLPEGPASPGLAATGRMGPAGTAWWHPRTPRGGTAPHSRGAPTGR